MNGTEPDEFATRYGGPFEVQTSTEVRARAYAPGYNESTVASEFYVLPEPGVLVVLPESGLNVAGSAGGPFVPSYGVLHADQCRAIAIELECREFSKLDRVVGHEWEFGAR